MKRSDFDPRKQPPHIQKILAAVLILAAVWCLFACMGSTLPELLFHDLPIHLFFALVIDAVILIVCAVISGAGNSKNPEKLEAAFAQNGYCAEIEEILKAKLPAPSDSDKVLRAFVLVMAGNYQEADEQFAEIPTNALSERDFAMLMTAKCKLMLIRGQYEKASWLFTEHQAKLDAAFAQAPVISAPYAADTQEYYSLAAVFCELMQQPDKAADYRSKAISLTAELPEASVYRGILELQTCYASGQTHAAHSMEPELQHAAAALTAPVTAGTKQNLRRLIDEAKYYSASRLAVRPHQGAARNLPEPAAQTVPEGLAEL